MGYPIPSCLRAFLTSLPASGASRRKLRFRFDDFFSSMWLFIARRRRILPAAVTLNLFFAPLCVFCFGICLSLQSGVFRRAQHHDHVAAVEERRLLDRADL